MSGNHGLTLVLGIGYRAAEIEALMTPEGWADFSDWMYGQTMGMGPGGEALIYPQDLDRYLGGHRDCLLCWD